MLRELFPDYIIEEQHNVNFNSDLFDFCKYMKSKYENTDLQNNKTKKIKETETYTIGGFQMSNVNDKNVIDYTTNDGVKEHHANALKKLKTNIIFPTIENYVKTLSLQLKEKQYLEYRSWFVLYDKDSFQEFHTHPNSLFTTIYYIETPINVIRNEGDLVIHDIKSKWNGLNKIYIKPKPGLCVTIPGYYPHGTMPFSSFENRACIVVDVELKTKL